MSLMHTASAADSGISLTYNGKYLNVEPVLVNDRTLVPVRGVCDAMGLDVSWNSDTQQVRICDEFNLVSLWIGKPVIDINDEIKTLDASPVIIDGITCVPLRAVLEPFGAQVGWDAAEKTVVVTSGGTPAARTEQTKPAVNTAISEKNNTFYCQPDPEWGFERSGRGYCWVCSYAMLISDLTGAKVTPADVAEFNISHGGSSGSYMSSHFGLAETYGLKFVPALSEDSKYFSSFETDRRGATYIKAETDDEVRAALIEALARNPKGVMVRFEGYPHTMVATGTYDGKVYFNDPAGESLENVDFSGTCLSTRWTLSDITFIQAMALKN